MFAELQQPAVWIIAIAAVAVLGGVGLWLRKRKEGSLEAGSAPGGAQDVPVASPLESSSNLANTEAPSSAHGGGMVEVSPIVPIQPGKTKETARSPAEQDDNSAGEVSRPKKKAPAKRPGRKKAVAKKASQKKAARKK